MLLNSYYATAHNSQPNYVAQISGQGPNPQMQGDCQIYSQFVQAGTVAPGQAVGSGCVFPAGVASLPSQLSDAGISWKGYMEDMGTPCRHPALNTQDTTQTAKVGDQYAVRHDPFVYFSAITASPSCAQHVVDLSRLPADLASASTTPALSYITPNLCDDGHDSPCVDGRPGGLASVNAWLKTWVPKILNSPAYKTDGMLVITADEADSPAERRDGVLRREGGSELAAAGHRRPGRRPNRGAGAVPLDERQHLEHHAVQPLLAAGLAGRDIRDAVPGLREDRGPEPLRARRLQQRVEIGPARGINSRLR